MGFMQWNLYTDIIDDYEQMMKKYGFEGNLSYCQMGEPFILRGISKWVKYAIEKGIYVYFNTNASLLSRSLVDSLIDIGFNGRFNISFHGIYKDTYKKVMGIDFDKTLRNIDYVARYGGEEFCAILLNTVGKAARLSAERIRINIEQNPLRHDGTPLHTAVSVGVAMYPEDSDQEEDLINCADKALYRAKASGRNRVVMYNEEQDVQ